MCAFMVKLPTIKLKCVHMEKQHFDNSSRQRTMTRWWRH